jgi:hypothetical protein
VYHVPLCRNKISLDWKSSFQPKNKHPYQTNPQTKTLKYDGEFSEFVVFIVFISGIRIPVRAKDFLF